MRKKLFFSFIIILLPTFLYSSIGTSAGRILIIERGSRPLGIGGAFTGISNDINAIFYNPAGLVNIKGIQIETMYKQGVFGSDYGVIEAGYRLDKKQALGISLVYLNLGKIEIVKVDGTTENKTAQMDFLYSLTYAYKFWDKLSLGVNIKYLYSSFLSEYTASSFSIDLAGLYSPNISGWDRKKNEINIGLVIQNIGTKLKYFEKNNSIPLNVRLGVGYIRTIKKQDKLTIGVDGIVNLSEKCYYLNIGTEYNFLNIIALRIGYRIGYDLDAYTFGIGMEIKRYQLNYSFIPMGEDAFSQQASFILKF